MTTTKRQRTAATTTAATAAAAAAAGAILVRVNLHMLLGLVILVLSGLCIYFYMTRNLTERTTTTVAAEFSTTPEYRTGGQTLTLAAVPPLADVLRNPYEAPLRDDRFFPTPTGGVATPAGGLATINLPTAVAINVPTQGPFIEPTYRQIGLLTRLKKEGSKKGGGAEVAGNDDSLVFPLMGKPLLVNRDTWNFYTMNDKFHTMKLPVIHKGRSGTSENGCENIYTNDRVRVEGYDDEFRATVYENQTMRYLPYF